MRVTLEFHSPSIFKWTGFQKITLSSSNGAIWFLKVVLLIISSCYDCLIPLWTGTIGGRPKSEYRTLFLQLVPPHNPVSKNDITHYIWECMQKNNLSASTYWLRHSYAQNLLESGASIYEIKEMMGHKTIESTRRYLSIHINLMREIILDETF